MAWETEPGAGNPGRQRNGEPGHPAMEEDRFLDQHIEETLDTIDRAARTREGALDADGQSLD